MGHRFCKMQAHQLEPLPVLHTISMEAEVEATAWGSGVTMSLWTPALFLMPPVLPPSLTRSRRSRPVSEASCAPMSEESMGSSLFKDTPLATVKEMYDSSFF
jgi:hypothetical protein